MNEINAELPLDTKDLTEEQVLFALRALQGTSSLQTAIALGIKDADKSKELFLKAAKVLKDYMHEVGVSSDLSDEEMDKVMVEAWQTVRDSESGKSPAPTLFPATQQIH